MRRHDKCQSTVNTSLIIKSSDDKSFCLKGQAEDTLKVKGRSQNMGYVIQKGIKTKQNR